MKHLKIYNIKDDYINFLRESEPKVSYNKNGSRPYIGIVFEIDNFTYFAPLSSPKIKHITMKNTADFIKIQEGKLGAINLNNMIPVSKSNVMLYDIANETDIKYQKLLVKQVIAINGMKENIWNKARNLRNNVYKNKNYLNGRCCNFKILEEMCIAYDRKQGFEKKEDFNELQKPGGEIKKKSLAEQLQEAKAQMNKVPRERAITVKERERLIR